VIVSEHKPPGSPEPEVGVDHAGHCGLFSTFHGVALPVWDVFNDDEALRKSIRSNSASFLGNIDKVRGKTEMH